MQDFEKLGEFYLGKRYDLERKSALDELILYDSKDLTTHAVCVGMTGSGKTGLCLSLLEEAAIDGIPVIAIDPKGDLGNLLLTFPDLQPGDFRPWVDEAAALRAGKTGDEFAAATATQWREGLAKWGQSPERIAAFRNAVDLAIYTPGSSSGLPLTVLQSFDAPAPEVLSSADALRDRISSAASGLLALLSIEADPVQSREHILLSNLLDRAWRQGRNLNLESLIRQVQAPPMEKLGVLELESFFPEKERAKLAMTLNNLLASPSFAAWLEGEPLDVKHLLHTAEGKPRISIMSIAHLSDAERMFFVTLLLNEVLAWVRSQTGTTSLRAILYMDEVFGYFPPVANPPSKLPMLTLLKQARAFGVGIVLATQNPVDLDYKGLSNTGTWFLGRLQTERDKGRVLEGLEGAAAQTGMRFDRAQMEATLAGLGNRVFLMNNVHEDAPVVFQTRWALSYLRGPLTGRQIEVLMAPKKQHPAEPADPAAPAEEENEPKAGPEPLADLVLTPNEPAAPPAAPAAPAGIEQIYIRPAEETPPAEQSIYTPAIYGEARLHFIRKSLGIDAKHTYTVLQRRFDCLPNEVWENATVRAGDAPPHDSSPRAGVRFAALPEALASRGDFGAWKKQLIDYLYRTQALVVWRSPQFKEDSQPGESERDFRVRLAHLAHEERDGELEKLRDRYASKIAKIEKQLQTAQRTVASQKSQSREAVVATTLSWGETLAGMLFGRKLVSRTNVGKTSRSIRRTSKAADERADVAQAEENVNRLREEQANLDAELQSEIAALRASHDPQTIELEKIAIPPRKSDLTITRLALAWVPKSLRSNPVA
jgi:hypothetical protein